MERADKSLYTGITTDLDRRVQQHNSGKGAKYTRGRTPVKTVYAVGGYDKSRAAKEEARIKKLSRKQKLELIG